MIPTKSAPGGCLVALFGLGALAFAGLSFFAAWLIYSKQAGERYMDHATQLAIFGAVALILGIILILAGWKLSKGIDSSYDPGEPDEPRIKF